MRILFATFPGYGHFHPMVPLAAAAVEHGDDVLVAAGPEFGRWVRACGLSAVPAGLDLDELFARSRGDAKFPGGGETVQMFTTVAVPPMVADLVELSERWPPDLIVHEEAEYGAPLVAALLGVPCVTHSWAAPARPETEQRIFVAPMEPIWAQHHADAPRLRGEIYLDACPPPFQTDAIDTITGVRPIRPVPFDGPPTSPPEWLTNLKRPAAYVTLGTVSQFSQAEALQRATDAAARVAASVVVTTGPNPVEDITAPSASVFVAQYLPQSTLLDRVDVVVSHGGAGTTLGAIHHDLPHVVIPQHGSQSQKRNGERVDALRIGICSTSDDAQSLADAIHSAITDPAFKFNAARLRDSLTELPAPETVLAGLLTDFT
jgi:UDP:flavonoid glycosyltransferase YjiC (YdhE family)